MLKARLPAIEALLIAHGYVPRVLTTTVAAHSARDLALTALDSAMVLACGGDGTIHGVVQALAGTCVALGVLPTGTANALARNLQLPLDPVRALEALLAGTTRMIPLGQITTAQETRWFAVLAGCGPDGALVQTLPAARKARLGRAAYYAQAGRLFLTRRWPAFRVEFRLAGSAEWQSVEATALLASRVPDLGGLFSGLTPGANLGDLSLHVQLLRGPAMLAFPAWFGLRHRLLSRHNPWLTTVDAGEVRCSPLTAAAVFAEADGEALGAIPMGLSVVPDALKLMVGA